MGCDCSLLACALVSLQDIICTSLLLASAIYESMLLPSAGPVWAVPVGLLPAVLADLFMSCAICKLDSAACRFSSAVKGCRTPGVSEDLLAADAECLDR